MNIACMAWSNRYQMLPTILHPKLFAPKVCLLAFLAYLCAQACMCGMPRGQQCAHACMCGSLMHTACMHAAWFHSRRTRWRALRHVHMHARLAVAMLDELHLVGRTAELAKTFGIDWHSVVARGSQYRVESMLARLAHTQNLLLVRRYRYRYG